MGYLIFGKVKTIVLPLVDTGENGLTIDDYREKTGIDLRDIIGFESGSKRIVLKNNALYLLENTPEFSAMLGYTHVPAIGGLSGFQSKPYSANTRAELALLCESTPMLGGHMGAIILFAIPLDKSLSIDNVIVVCNEA